MGEANLGLLKKLFHKKNTDEMNFSSIKTHEMALELYQKNILALLYIVPLKFGGEDERSRDTSGCHRCPCPGGAGRKQQGREPGAHGQACQAV